MVIERFGFERDTSMEAVQRRLRDLEKTIRRRIDTETKIKEGAEKLRHATSDKKSLARVLTIVNDANSTLVSLNQELSDVRTYLLMTANDSDRSSAAVAERTGELQWQCDNGNRKYRSTNTCT